jgi:hypothetical protein
MWGQLKARENLCSCSPNTSGQSPPCTSLHTFLEPLQVAYGPRAPSAQSAYKTSLQTQQHAAQRTVGICEALVVKCLSTCKPAHVCMSMSPCCAEQAYTTRMMLVPNQHIQHLNPPWQVPRRMLALLVPSAMRASVWRSLLLAAASRMTSAGIVPCANHHLNSSLNKHQ